ncbi:MFS transporter [Actinoplanes lobatus]|uniref:MFS transporter n=1 Tax=Actinoplanes lobatus TaxID=113568 RepID=A0A7W7HKV7_9ACTN|nr:MFS transporter [Actinoplanes lobatus]MBB4752412.1 putative MFS family arabinose efflux permease [Actinoplanes lobatus]GGN95108.1 MFS transporter [Actinoplanes lobatus]GIE46122.1 MFS transporter [Actinoplanes lobatus]
MTVPATVGRRPGPATRHRLVALLAVTQTVGYGAMIQAFTVLLTPLSTDLGQSRATVAAAATVSTLTGAIAAVPVGRLLDRAGGRLPMTAGSALGAAAVAGWSQVHSVTGLYLCFAAIGVALALSTYEAAFAVLVVALDPRHRDGAIVAVTMVTGFATSCFYPLVGRLEAHLGWRATLLALAAGLAVIAVPIHLWALPGRQEHVRSLTGNDTSGPGVPYGPPFWLLSFAFVAQTGTVTAFLLMMVTYFRDIGFSPATAATIPLAVGSAQILSRLVLVPLARRYGMTEVTAVAFVVQALGLLALPLAGAGLPATLLCAAAFGAGYGVGVVARPSILADTFGVTRFAGVVAVTAVPMALARAAAPLAGAWVLDWRFPAILGGITLLAAMALVPVAARRDA